MAKYHSEKLGVSNGGLEHYPIQESREIKWKNNMHASLEIPNHTITQIQVIQRTLSILGA
jgi:hypothetical protein